MITNTAQLFSTKIQSTSEVRGRSCVAPPAGSLRCDLPKAAPVATMGFEPRTLWCVGASPTTRLHPPPKLLALKVHSFFTRNHSLLEDRSLFKNILNCLMPSSSSKYTSHPTHFAGHYVTHYCAWFCRCVRICCTTCLHYSALQKQLNSKYFISYVKH